MTRQPRGLALMLVVILIALATVMGYALLATTTIQASVSKSSVQAAQSDALAESGINLANYYLQNPANASLTGMQTYWPGASNISFGSTAAGTCDVSVTLVSRNIYEITSTGRSSTTLNGQSISRTIKTRVKLAYSPSVDYAIGSNGSLALPNFMRVTGSVKAKGIVSVATGAVVDTVQTVGNVLTAIFGGASNPGPVPVSAPTFKTYVYNGVTYNATEITTSSLANITLGPTPTNPAGVYWRNGSLAMGSNVVINGTLLTESNVQLAGSANVITPQEGFPAMIVKGQIQIAGMNRELTANGLIYLGGSITRGGGTQAGSKFNVNGALLFYNTNQSIDSAYNGQITVKYDASKIAVLGVGNATSTAKSVQVQEWTQ